MKSKINIIKVLSNTSTDEKLFIPSNTKLEFGVTNTRKLCISFNTRIPIDLVDV